MNQSPAAGLAGFSPDRVRAARIFIIVGFAAIVAGGAVAAVTGPADLAQGSWVAAYLVLVVGVAQLALGLGQAWLSAVPPAGGLRAWQLGTYNVANAAVLVGTLTEAVAAVLGGGALLLVALVLFFRTVHGTSLRRPYAVAYQLVIAILMVSIPIGLTLSVLRH